MIGKPKYKAGDIVRFKIEETIYEGGIWIIDKYGTFEDDSDVSYDIMVTDWDGSQCLYKHINERLIIDNKVNE